MEFSCPFRPMSNITSDSHSIGLANSQIISSGFTSNTPPSSEIFQTGQSVRNVPTHTTNHAIKQWFAVRATQGRAKSVFDKLQALAIEGVKPYLPVKKEKKVILSKFDRPQQVIEDIPLIPSLLFVNCTQPKFKELLNLYIPGFTPYYDHCHADSFGINSYLTIPDRQFESFTTIIESGWQDTIINQKDAPDFLIGDKVRVIGGPFEGVEGIVMKYKHQQRVFVELNGIGRFGTGYIHKGYLQKI